jgi:hypothetical protein
MMFQLTSRIGLFVVNHPPETPELFAATEPPKRGLIRIAQTQFLSKYANNNQNKSSKNGKIYGSYLKNHQHNSSESSEKMAIALVKPAGFLRAAPR